MRLLMKEEPRKNCLMQDSKILILNIANLYYSDLKKLSEPIDHVLKRWMGTL